MLLFDWSLGTITIHFELTLIELLVVSQLSNPDLNISVAFS